MGNVHRLHGRLLPHPNKPTIQEIPAISCPRSIIPIQNATFGLSTAPQEFTVVVKEVKLMAQSKGIRIYLCLDNGWSELHPAKFVSSIPRSLVALCQELGWVVNIEKSELESKQIVNFIGYQYDLRPTLEHWQTLNFKI